MLLLGLDIGTTGCKASLFEDDGRLLASAWREYSIDMPHPSWAEQDAEQVWRLAQEAMSEVYHKLGGHQAILALSLSVQGEAVMPVDRRGNALRPAILGMDTRTGGQNRWLEERFGNRDLFQRTGMPIHTINTLPKLLWLKDHDPETWEAAHRFLLYEDFLINKLAGRAVISRCLASRTQMFDLHQGCWSEEILEAIGLAPERLAQVYPSGVAVGAMAPVLVEQLGFPNAPLIVTGGHDQACGSLGVGLTRPGLSMVSTGTAEVVEVALDSPVLTQALAEGNISVYNHVVPGLFLAMTLNHSGGLILRWFRDTFCPLEVAAAHSSGADPYDLIYRDLTPGPSPVLLLPHFSGSGTPHFDTLSKGALVGLTFGTTKADIAKAILEGLTFELRYNLETLNQGQVLVEELRAIGGGARSKLWLQLKADITGLRVLAPRITEAASWGAAALAGAGAGIFKNAAQAVEEALRFEQVYEPRPEQQAVYQKRYELYRQLYPALAELHHRMEMNTP